MKTRRLEDLYIVGDILKLDDGEGAVEVWLQKITPLHAEKALRAANAKRAKIFAMHRDRDSELFLGYISELYEKTQDEIIEEVAEEDIQKKSEVLEAELEAEKEWSDHNYYQGLRDLWAEKLFHVWLDNPEDEEAKRVFTEFERFAEQLKEKLDPEITIIKRQVGMTPQDELEKKWIEKKIELEAAQEWMREFRKQEIFYATRCVDDHKKFYFPTREAIDELTAEVFLALVAKYNVLNVDVTEGKESPSAENSSPSSEQQDNQATEESSGLADVTV